MTNDARRFARHRTQCVIAALTAVSVLTLAACGDDDEETTSTTAAPAAATTEAAVATTTPPATTEASAGTDAPADIAPEYAEYCAIAAELDAQEDFPSDEQLEELRAVAPDEIAEEINTVADALIEAEDPLLVFGDPVIGAAFEPIETFEAENCGLHGDEEDEEAQDPSVTEIDPDATRVDIAATDFAFGGTPPSEAGRYSIVMENAGETLHMMILIKLEEGAVLDEVLESEGESGVAEEYSSDEVLPGAEAVVTADLTPGNWVLLCPLPTPEGTPHFVEGMIVEFAIT
jgi:hypothetical protein